MSKADEYRQRAAACERNAAAAESEESRESWLSIARDWRAMVPEELQPADADVQPAAPEAPVEIGQAIDGIALSSLEQEIARWMHDSRQRAG